MLALDGYREIAVLVDGTPFRLVRAEREHGTTVLVKTMAGSVPDSSAADQLQKEFELERRLHHPALIEPIAFVPGPRPALLLADDGGRTLRDVVDDGPLSLREALSFATGIASGIAELHRHDIVHRDITPANVMVAGDASATRIIDLSLATVVPRQQAALLTPSLMLGSLPYISPEQTGRTSRPVDFRTDLYSLGVTLFEMLAGTTPFTSTEPLELVHDHLAVPAPRIADIRDGVPEVVDDLVARLLEKDPGDRYRSAVGVVQDLERIHDRVVRGLDADTIELDGEEISTKFQIPDRLFGRSSELGELVTWLHRAARGRTSLLFVHGYSGVGKSSLIEELRQPTNELRGYVATGKSEPVYQGPAREVVAAALRDLIRQLLTEDDGRIKALRRKLRDVLGNEAGVLSEVVPAIRPLLRGVHAQAPSATARERGHFNRLAARFLSAVATPDRPVALVLDDLHWADAATIDFIEQAVVAGHDGSLLVVAAFRDNEVDASHPIIALQQRLGSKGVPFGDIALGPLSEDAVAELVAASVGRTVADAAPLSVLCLQATAGNPLSIRLFLRSLYENGLLQLDSAGAAWSWDVDEVRLLNPSEQMVGLATDKISSLSEPTQFVLGVMAVVGTQGDAELLSEIGIDDAFAALQELAAQDLVQLTDDPPRLLWEFAHDRIRDAAGAIINDGELSAWQERIGRTLERRLASFHSDTSIFDVLRHLNAAATATQPTDPALAVMNLQGGRSSMRATDYGAALAYFSTGVVLLGPDQWDDDPKTAFSLHLGAADAARLMADFGEMNRWVQAISASATDEDQLVEATLRKILFLSHRGQHLEAIDLARAALADLGWSLPASSRRRDALTRVARLARTRVRLSMILVRAGRVRDSTSIGAEYDYFGRSDPQAGTNSVGSRSIWRSAEPRYTAGSPSSIPTWASPMTAAAPVRAGSNTYRSYVAPAAIDRLLELPQMGDPTARNMIRLLNEALISAYWTDRDIMTVMIVKGIDLCVDYGTDPTSALFYAFYGALVSAIGKDTDTGLAYADTAVNLTRTLGTLSKPSRVRLTRDVLVAPAKVPLHEIESSLEHAHTRGMDTGDVAVATSALLFLSLHRFLSGEPLDRVDEAAEAAHGELHRHGQTRNVASAQALRQLVHDLRHAAPDGVPFSGPFVDGDDFIRTTHGPAGRMTLCWVHTLRAIARWHSGDHAGARADIEAGSPHLDAVLGQALVPVHHLYGVLASAPPNGKRSLTSRHGARAHRRRLAWFAKNNATQHQASLLVADASIATHAGDVRRAERLLAAAADLAVERSEYRTNAIATSLAMQIAQNSGDSGATMRHRRAANAAYEAWGATALTRGLADESPSDRAHDSEDLDLTTVVRASEAISEQIELDSLLQRLMEVVLQSAGAERGVLFRVEGERPIPEAEGHIGVGTAQVKVRALDPADQPDVAESIVRLVSRTSEPVLIDRARDDRLLQSDESTQARGVRSVLCLPLVTQGRLEGILYLENNQVDGAFTATRLRLLRILSSQVASALEKARLHDAQRRLIEAQDRFVPAQFLTTLGHSNLLDVQRGQGTLKTVDILFTDIRAFTTMVETMSPSHAMEFVNDYLSHMEPLVHEYGGFIDTYDGDSILALFDAGSDAGVRAAVAMAHAERHDNELRAADGLPPVLTGFGLNTAGVMMGIVGGASALRATIIGDAVNVASRVESLTKRYGTRMLISENTAVRLRPDTSITLRPLERVQLVGKTQALQVFEVLDALGPTARSLRLGSLDGYNEALLAYERGELAAACRGFADVAAADPTDTPVAVMVARTEALIEAGEDLSGPPITRLQAK